ncbi:DUF1365 domain-containing protein [Leptospira kobayashii]|nr:DUF1365 domain-containing protein [Leptospira kobayashii]
MNSVIYKASVSHTRTKPVKNQFTYKVFTFLIDLQELGDLDRNSFFFRRNRFGFFSFYDKDHLQFGKKDTYENVKSFLTASGIKDSVGKIYLLTNLRILGYVFNPVSFYFCFSESGTLICSVPEVGNTFGEIKPYVGLVNSGAKGTISDPQIHLRTKKNFYVSPFISLDSEFEFRLNFPEGELKIGVDSWEEGERILTTSFLGKKISFTDENLFILFCQYPFITVKIIALIHWQAVKLWIRKIPYIKKDENPNKQTGVSLGQVSEPVSLTKSD